MFHKLFFECKDAATVCDKAQYNEASTSEKLRFKIHILICKMCNKHSKRNTNLSKCIDRFKSTKLNDSEKQMLQLKIEEELKNKH